MPAQNICQSVCFPQVNEINQLIINYHSFADVMQPRIAAVDEIGLNILSPNILSPRFNSSEKFMIELMKMANLLIKNIFRILSPHILGGEHETSDEEILNEEEDKKADHEVHEGQQHGGNKVK